jgi:hypothetical protein
MISFSTFEASSMICLILASNSHLNFVPATSIVISSARIFLSLIENGTSQLAIFLASHSTIAVLPTPGSPTKTGLFFVFLFSIAISLSISSSLPKTGSSLPFFASSVKFVEKKSRAGVVESDFALSFEFGLLSNGVVHSSSSSSHFPGIVE